VVGKTGGAYEVIVTWALLEPAGLILVIERAACPPNPASSIAEIVSNCSLTGMDNVGVGIEDDTAVSRLEIMPIPSTGALGSCCRASISLWMWFLWDLPSWQARKLNAAAAVGGDRVKRRCRRAKVEADAFQRVILAM